MPRNFLNHLQWYARAMHLSQASAAEAVGTCSLNPQIYECCSENLIGGIRVDVSQPIPTWKQVHLVQ